MINQFQELPSSNDEKKVTIKTMTISGEEEKTLTISEAIAELKKQKENGKWLFINGHEKNIYDLDEEDFIDMEDAEIMLTHGIQGG